MKNVGKIFIYLAMAVFTYAITIGLYNHQMEQEHWSCNSETLIGYSFPIAIGIIWPVGLPSMLIDDLIIFQWVPRPHLAYTVPTCPD